MNMSAARMRCSLSEARLGSEGEIERRCVEEKDENSNTDLPVNKSAPPATSPIGDAAEFPLLGDYKHVENHAVCRGELQAEWKAGELRTRIRRFAMCDVAVFATDGRIVAAASGAVDFASVGRLAGEAM